MSSNDFTSHDRIYVTPLPKADLVGRLRQHADAEIHNKLRYIVRADKLMRAAADRISSLESELHRHHASLFMRATQLAGEPFVPVELAHSIAMDVSPIRDRSLGHGPKPGSVACRLEITRDCSCNGRSTAVTSPNRTEPRLPGPQRTSVAAQPSAPRGSAAVCPGMVAHPPASINCLFL